MKYDGIIFDFGNTLAYTEKDRFLIVPPEALVLVRSLFKRGYLLGIISNSNQKSDSGWVRSRLQSNVALDVFEVVLCVWKPDEVKPNKSAFKRVLGILGTSPEKTLMVGDSEKCDGGCQKLGMDFLKVSLSDGWWGSKLEAALK